MLHIEDQNPRYISRKYRDLTLVTFFHHVNVRDLHTHTYIYIYIYIYHSLYEPSEDSNPGLHGGLPH